LISVVIHGKRKTNVAKKFKAIVGFPFIFLEGPKT